MKRASVIERIQHCSAGRDPERLRLKYRAMRSEVFAFLRGTAHLFYDRLPKSSLLSSAPLVWACGDLHLENFGSYKGDNRLVYFDMNDFDEAALAPLTWDLVRFVASVHVGARSLKVNELEATALCRCFLDAYRAALQEGKARWVERETAEGMVKELLDSLRQRARKDFLDSRTERDGGKRVIRIDGKKALAVTKAQRRKVETFIKAFAVQQPDRKFFKLLDVARRIAGTSSLGVERYVLLIEGKGSPDANYLLDLKPALPSALEPHLTFPQPKWKTDAERVVALQKRVQAISPAFLRPVAIGDVSYVLKALQPAQDRVALGHWGGKLRRLERVMVTMGEVVAWGQLRSSGRDGSAIADELIEFAADSRWRPALLELAAQCVKRVETDWQEFCAGFDRGALT